MIVIVDDEEMVLTSLRSFLNLETEYEIETYTLAEEGARRPRQQARWIWSSPTI